MTNDLPPRRTIPVRTWLLSVTGLAVVASLVIWHAQVIALFDNDSSGDKQPVVAGAPGGSAPTAIKTRQTMPPTAPPSAPPTSKSTPKPTKSPSKKPTTKPTESRASEKGAYAEEDINGLSSKLRTRLKKAIAAAKVNGVKITITSARRSEAKQRRLLKEAIVKYGSYQAAIKWVLPPEDSAHVQGKAVDIGPQAGMTWLNKNGWKFGVCRRYDNEPWHFEALTAPGTKCPARETNATAQAG